MNVISFQPKTPVVPPVSHGPTTTQSLLDGHFPSVISSLIVAYNNKINLVDFQHAFDKKKFVIKSKLWAYQHTQFIALSEDSKETLIYDAKKIGIGKSIKDAVVKKIEDKTTYPKLQLDPPSSFFLNTLFGVPSFSIVLPQKGNVQITVTPDFSTTFLLNQNSKPESFSIPTRIIQGCLLSNNSIACVGFESLYIWDTQSGEAPYCASKSPLATWKITPLKDYFTLHGYLVGDTKKNLHIFSNEGILQRSFIGDTITFLSSEKNNDFPGFILSKGREHTLYYGDKISRMNKCKKFFLGIIGMNRESKAS